MAQGVKGTSARCSVEGCLNSAAGRGLCKKHWQNWSRWGHPTEKSFRGRGPCAVEGCAGEIAVVGEKLCEAHYRRLLHGRSFDTPINGHRISEDRVAAAVELVNIGWSWKYAAHEIGISVGTLRQRARNNPEYNVREGSNRAIKPQNWRRPVEETDLAYLAGLLDGEGTIGIYNAEETERPRCITVSIVNTHLPVLEWVASMGGRPVRIKSKKKAESHLGKLVCYEWIMSARMDVIAFLEAVVPYMRIKQDRARLALKLLDEWTNGARIRQKESR